MQADAMANHTMNVKANHTTATITTQHALEQALFQATQNLKLRAYFDGRRRNAQPASSGYHIEAWLEEEAKWATVEAVGAWLPGRTAVRTEVEA